MPKDAFLDRGFAFQCPAWGQCQLNLVLLVKVRWLNASIPAYMVALLFR